MLCTLLGLGVLAVISLGIWLFSHLMAFLDRRFGEWLPLTIIMVPTVLIGAYTLGRMLCDK
jgi:hypothetical protein